MKLLSPAKINLFLNVLRKRKDGYHEIETLFERVSLCDEIILTPRKSGIVVESDSKKIPRGPNNLAWRAAKLLKDRFKIRKGVHIQIKKRIPVSAGLGGGSSNAATVLLGLNRLWKLGLSKKQLMKLGAKLGSDVPFFILETPFAWATGRGEKLEKGTAPKGRCPLFWHVIVKPPFEISTKEAYEKVPLTGEKADVKMLFRNSFELIENNRVKKVLEIKNLLIQNGAQNALMSGSGSAVFGIFRTKTEAQKTAKRLTKKGWQVFVASTY